MRREVEELKRVNELLAEDDEELAKFYKERANLRRTKGKQEEEIWEKEKRIEILESNVDSLKTCTFNYSFIRTIYRISRVNFSSFVNALVPHTSLFLIYSVLFFI